MIEARDLGMGGKTKGGTCFGHFAWVTQIGPFLPGGKHTKRSEQFSKKIPVPATDTKQESTESMSHMMCVLCCPHKNNADY